MEEEEEDRSEDEAESEDSSTWIGETEGHITQKAVVNPGMFASVERKQLDKFILKNVQESKEDLISFRPNTYKF